jgi:hypothetical protein
MDEASGLKKRREEKREERRDWVANTLLVSIKQH